MARLKVKKMEFRRIKLALFDQLIAANRATERKGANNAYAAVNGNMYLLMQPSGSWRCVCQRMRGKTF